MVREFQIVGGMAGIRTLLLDSAVNQYALHLGVAREFWQWGYIEEWYDGPIYSFGLGPLFLLCWHECRR